MRHLIVCFLVGLLAAGCANKPLLPYTTDTTPVMLVPAIQHKQQDERGRFREIFCAVLEAGKDSLPDHLPCQQALARVGQEPAGRGGNMQLGPAQRRLQLVFVPGLAWDCISDWLGEQDSVPAHLRQIGYDMVTVNVGGLASSAANALMIRDEITRLPPAEGRPNLVLLGYSKGAADALVALANYPEIRGRLAAFVSLAGTVGGSPLANDATDGELNLLRHFPGAKCQSIDGGALQDLLPEKRRSWLNDQPLPDGIPYYSLITFPEPEKISTILRGGYGKLAWVDSRNDSQVIYYDQFLPNSRLVAFLNADHWAVAVPIARTHDVLAKFLIDKNAFPREALYEALLRLIEEDLQKDISRN